MDNIGMRNTGSQHEVSRLLTREEVSQLIGRKRTSIHYAVQRGELVAVKLGRSLRFRPEDVQRYIERNLTEEAA